MYTAIVNLTDFSAGSVGLGEGWVAPAGAGIVVSRSAQPHIKTLNNS